MMEQDLVEGSVATAAAAALASAATKAKVKPALPLQNGPIAGTYSEEMVVIFNRGVGFFPVVSQVS